MTSKERGFTYEAIALIAAGFFGAFVVPSLVNSHDSVALLSAVMLLAGWAGWSAYFLYRLTKGLAK